MVGFGFRFAPDSAFLIERKLWRSRTTTKIPRLKKSWRWG